MDYFILIACALSLCLSVIALLQLKKARYTSDKLIDAIIQMDKQITDKTRAMLSGELRENRTEILTILSQTISANAKASGESQSASLDLFRRTVQDLSTGLDKRMGQLGFAQSESLSQLRKEQHESLNSIKNTMEARLESMQKDNQTKLDQMRQTVDEKLQKTLDERLGQSFSTVSERLEQVYKGLGEMRLLATGVGDLKKVLTNVKTRGTMGEIQLSRILEQLMTTAQYAKNIATKRGSRENVEYAIKLPGRADDDRPVYLPIDAKFPMEDYRELMDSYDTGDAGQIEFFRKKLENAIKKSAKDIHDKYIDPPNTTDFGILFLPIEGLYAEIVRNNDLLETLQNTYHVNVAGPTTLSALLNSLQLGFKTLAIEKRSHEVWNILKSVKTEFIRFKEALDTAQKRIKQADADIDKLVGVRTNQMLRRLRDVEELPQEEAKLLLETAVEPYDIDIEEDA